MSSSAAKKDDDQLAEVVELSLVSSNDREQGLSNNFDDPNLAELIPGLVDASSPAAAPAEPMSLVQETAEAVQELVTDAQGTQSAVDLSANFGELQLTADSDSHNVEPGEITMSGIIAPATEQVTEASSVPTQDFDPDPPMSAQLSTPLVTNVSDLPADSMEEPAQLFVMDDNEAGVDSAHARSEMSEKLFQLVVCERSFDDLVETALVAIMHSVGAQAGAVLELDTEHEEYFFRTSIGGGDPEKVKSFRVPMHKGIVGHVGESRQATLLRDLEADQMQMRAISMSVGFEAKTCMAAPILVAGQLFGVIEFFNRKDGSFFEQSDLQLLEDGTRMLSKVLEVRFLMAELMRRAR